MSQTVTVAGAGMSSDVLLATYQLLIETTLESSTDEIFLQRAVAVLSAVPWPSSGRCFSAFLPAPDGGSLSRAAATTGAAACRPCSEASATRCLCGRALLSKERLLCIEAAQGESPPCDPTGAGMHLILPLAARGRVWGVLHALVDPGPSPGERERSFLIQVGRLLGLELRRRSGEREHDRLESQFLQAQKMEAVGRLAGGVAHDFNNILTAITNHADLGLLKAPPPSAVRRHFEEIIASSERAALLTQQLLAFSRHQTLSPRVVDVNAVVTELGKTLRRLLGADIELTIATGAGPASILADPVLVEQVVINLALCARDAMPQGGTLLLQTARAEFDAQYTRAHPAVAPGTYLCLSLSAGGPGMDTGFLDELGGASDPAREPRGSATLGPAAIKDIIRQGGGRALVEVSDLPGVTARIFFPIIERTAAAASAAESSFQLSRGTETVLLAENDDSMRVVIGEVLRDLGYQVLEARDGREALALSTTYGGGIQILLTDVVLPGCGGHELHRLLGAAHPGIRALYVAGIMDNATERHGGLEQGDESLRKPFSPWALASKLRHVLDA